MKRALVIVCMLLFPVFLVRPIRAEPNPRAEFDSKVSGAIVKLNRESTGSSGVIRLAELIQSEYGTPVEDLTWAVAHDLSWGEIAAFAYIQSTTGRSFAELSSADARKDFWIYVEKSGMNSDKMVKSLEQFFRRAEKERNSEIFKRLRSTQKAERMPDLGSGFGLFQEALDFRRINVPQVTKIHDVGSSGLAKGDQ